MVQQTVCSTRLLTFPMIDKVRRTADLLFRIDHDLALDTVLTDVCPAVARLPLSLALRTLELSETAFRSLIGSQTFFARSRLQTEHVHELQTPLNRASHR